MDTGANGPPPEGPAVALTVDSQGRAVVMGAALATVRFQAGNDGAVRIGTDGTLRIAGTDWNDAIRVSRVGTNTLRVRVNLADTDYPLAAVKKLVIDAGAGDDTVEVRAGVAVPATILGGDGNDTLTGGDGADTLRGGAGDDRLDGGAGTDRLYGDAGNDRLRGRDGFADYLDGGAGTDSAEKDPVDGLFSIEQIV